MAISRVVKTGLTNAAENVLFQADLPVGSYQSGHVFGTVDVLPANGTDWHQTAVFAVAWNAARGPDGSCGKQITDLHDQLIQAPGGSLSLEVTIEGIDVPDEGSDTKLYFVVTPTTNLEDASIRCTYVSMCEHQQTVTIL